MASPDGGKSQVSLSYDGVPGTTKPGKSRARGLA